jgi:hypothetical protein
MSQSRSLLSKNSQIQIAGKLRKTVQLGKTISTEYAKDWKAVKLNTKDRSIRKEMSVTGALSKLSRTRSPKMFNISKIKLKNFGSFRSTGYGRSFGAKKNKTEHSYMGPSDSSKSKNRHFMANVSKGAPSEKLKKKMNSTVRGRFFTDFN